MFKIENIFLLLLIVICAIISFVLVDLTIGGVSIWELLQDTPRLIFTENQEGSKENQQLSQIDSGWQKFRSEGYAFEISYPPKITLENNPDQKSLNAGLDAPQGSPVWEFVLTDPAYYDGTNLVKASLVIQVISGELADGACTVYKPGSHFQREGELLPSEEINQTTFLKDIVGEGVMGGSYQLVSYRAFSQGACYELTEVMQSTNIENYPANSIESFDNQLVIEKLDQVLNTFRLLEIQATFPEMVYPEALPIEQVIEKSSGGYADGIDVSHWQGDIGWLQVAGANYSFAFVKGTEGVGWTDTMFHNNMAEGNNAGMYMGVYHYARPDFGNSGREEAEYFLSVAGDYLESGYLRPVLDLEERGSMGEAALSAWVLEWLQTVENQSGVAPLIYTNLWYINTYLTEAVTDYDLWIAYWTCDPTVTSSIPPTGKWHDWAFWQYCVASAGSVPGISKNIDLDIYNGIETTLGQYDAASPLWVSTISDANNASAPYYADITVDVNGDATGSMNYHIWWDCSSLDNNISTVEAACGSLPEPSPGECLKDDIGKRCMAVEDEVLLAEHTYQDPGIYTAKAIIERGGISPVEDRYQITVVNPIRTVISTPEAPGNGQMWEDYAIDTEVTIRTTVEGALQVDIIDSESLVVIDSDCVLVSEDVLSINDFTQVIPWSSPGVFNYSIAVRYRDLEVCPINDENTDDIYRDYEISWQHLLKDKVGYFDGTSNLWRLRSDNTYDSSIHRFIWGPSIGDWLPITGDWNGDGLDTAGFYDPIERIWKLIDENNFPLEIHRLIWGPEDGGWLPIAGDWDNDGIDTVGFYDPESRMWKMKKENNQTNDIFRYIWEPSEPGWLPITGDWDGNGRDSIGYYDPISREWNLLNENYENPEVHNFVWGPTMGNWIPISGDWDGDGRDTVGFYEPASKMWRLLEENSENSDVLRIIWGPVDETWIPIIGDW